MSKPIETLAGPDAAAFQEAINPHIVAVLTALGVIVGHDHDDRYFTETEADGRFAAMLHGHAIADIVGLAAELAAKANGAAVTAALAAKADAAAITVALAGKSNTGHGHDDLYYTKGEVTPLLAAKAAKGLASNGEFTLAATARMLGRKAAGAGPIEELTLSDILDLVGVAAQGDLLYRGAAGWARLGAGPSGQFLKTQGAGANPAWATLPGWTEIASVTPTGTGTVTFSSIPQTYQNLMLLFEGVSHDSGSNQSLNISVSPDGSAFGTAHSLVILATAASVYTGGVRIDGYRNSAGPVAGGITTGASAIIGAGNATTPNVWRCAGGIQALRAQWSGGNNDAGTYRLMGI
jgi:hypothetical protein